MRRYNLAKIREADGVGLGFAVDVSIQGIEIYILIGQCHQCCLKLILVMYEGEVVLQDIPHHVRDDGTSVCLSLMIRQLPRWLFTCDPGRDLFPEQPFNFIAK
jgi:hypothetical protein